LNNTHKTNPSAREDHNNNSGVLPAAPAVVVALTGQGISGKIADRLANHYSQERILEKLAYVEFLLAEQPEKVQNPCGWLRRAIEEDYGAPDGFVRPEERKRQEAEAAVKAQRVAAGEQQERAFVAQMQAQKEERKRQWQERYGTSEDDYRLWTEVLDAFKHSQPELHALYVRAQILTCRDGVVRLGFENEGALNRLDHPGTLAALKRQFKLIAKRPLEIERVLLPVEALSDAPSRMSVLAKAERKR
jgi:hypothetical protein